MTKRGFYQQYSIDAALDAVDNYEDNHYEEFQIIENNLLTQDNPVYKITRTHSLFWLYRADRKMIDSKTAYFFRFVNACHPNLYQSFEIKAHPFFMPIQGQRHRFIGWFKFTGQNLLDYLDQYLNIKRVVANQQPHVTKLFINQEQERLNIQFKFPSLNEQIEITFEAGYPGYLE